MKQGGQNNLTKIIIFRILFYIEYLICLRANCLTALHLGLQLVVPGGQVDLGVFPPVLYGVVVQVLGVHLQFVSAPVDDVLQGDGLQFVGQRHEFGLLGVPHGLDLGVLVGEFVLELVQGQVHVALVCFQLLLEIRLLAAQSFPQFSVERLPFFHGELFAQLAHGRVEVPPGSPG